MAKKAKQPANILEHSPDRDQRVKERAYHLWQADGEPHGRSQEFWERAEFLVGLEENADAGQLHNPAAGGAEPPPPVAVEEASLQDNLGEFPGVLTDQGDRTPTPSADAALAAKAPERSVGAGGAKPKATKAAAAEPAPRAPAPKAVSKPSHAAPAQAATAKTTAAKTTSPPTTPARPPAGKPAGSKPVSKTRK